MTVATVKVCSGTGTKKLYRFCMAAAYCGRYEAQDMASLVQQLQSLHGRVSTSGAHLLSAQASVASPAALLCLSDL